jgi:hypothetical protein
VREVAEGRQSSAPGSWSRLLSGKRQRDDLRFDLRNGTSLDILDRALASPST